MCINMDNNLALPSHVKVGESLAIRLPDALTFCEGATLPAVFMTSIYSLVNMAKIQAGETVLIHTGSGGVGLSAIQVAKASNANIIATAGSERKRTYLRKIVGIPHVFNSRTTEYAAKILEVTNGKGVDIILNSLTGPGFKEASLEALKTGGRFIEMSKLSVWTAEEVSKLRPDVEYHVVDVSTLPESQIQEILNSIKGILEGNTGFQIQPLPFERFDVLNIRAALYHLQQAKHIGKVVCVMPEIKKENSKLVPFTPLFNDKSTYVVTGGLGGIGFEVVKWMLKNGAKYVAIASRRQEPEPDIQGRIQCFNEKQGKRVRTFSVDVSDWKMCCDFFSAIQNVESGFPPIRGVMHAAGIMDNATFENLSLAQFELTYKSKVDGSLNLHRLTTNMRLEHFVMFSSVASILGAPGQSNYAASNRFQDALAHHRHSLGLPASSINWGHWGEVGMGVETDYPGMRPISTSEGLALLAHLLKSGGTTTQIMASNIENMSLLAQVFPSVKQLVEDTSLFEEKQKSQQLSKLTTDDFWKEVDAATDREEKVGVVKSYIKMFVRGILRLEADEPVGDQVDFQSLGIDSLMMLEMKNAIQAVLGSRFIITASHVKDCNTVHLLGNRLMDLIESKEEQEEIPTLEELRTLIHEDCQMVDHILINAIEPPTPIREIKVVLVTGATGNLGPYILKDLCNLRKNVSKIYCLVRSRSNLSGQGRLKQILEKCGINNCKEILEKVEVIEGDMAKENFGLDQETYTNLGKEVDAVVHCAVKSDHVAKYWKAPQDRVSNIRNVNVVGTKRVLEFASCQKIKHFFFASSLLVVTTTTTNGVDDVVLREDWQNDDDYDCLTYNSGYMISKFVSEQLVKHAMERGIPCKAFRFGIVCGDKKTGRLDILSSHYMLRLLAFLKLRCIPDTPLPMLLIPPNQCSEGMIRIGFNEGVSSGVFNVGPPSPQLEQVFVKVAKEFGVDVQVVNVSVFLERIEMEGDESPLAALKGIYNEDADRYLQVASQITSMQQWMTISSSNFFASKKLAGLIPGFLERIESADLIMKRDLGFAKEEGILEILGIEGVKTATN